MLNELITRASLEDLAGSTAFRRGEEYFSVGAVERFRATDDKVTARVEGTETYQVELRDDDGDLAYDCTCPRAANGYFCKHCVAVGLAWLAENSAASKSGATSGKKKRRDPWRDIKEYLTTQPPETLIDLLLDVAQRDDRLYQSLLLKAERTGGAGTWSRHSGVQSTARRASTALSTGGRLVPSPAISTKWRIHWRNCSSPIPPPCWSIWPSTPSSESKILWSRLTTRTARLATSSIAWASCISRPARWPTRAGRAGRASVPV